VDYRTLASTPDKSADVSRGGTTDAAVIIANAVADVVAAELDPGMRPARAD
jgi:hypothetical protein